MAKYIPTSTLDLALNQIKKSDYESICSQQPTTYFEACNPEMWVAETVYAVGDTTKAPTDNFMAYECTTGGTSGVGEPAWSETQDETFTDGTVTWKAHDNYSLVTAELLEADKTLADIERGRSLTFAEKVMVLSHREGTVVCTAFINSADLRLECVTVSVTSLAENNDIVAGRNTILGAVSIPLTFLA